MKNDLAGRYTETVRVTSVKRELNSKSGNPAWTIRLASGETRRTTLDAFSGYEIRDLVDGWLSVDGWLRPEEATEVRWVLETAKNGRVVRVREAEETSGR